MKALREFGKPVLVARAMAAYKRNRASWSGPAAQGGSVAYDAREKCAWVTLTDANGKPCFIVYKATLRPDGRLKLDWWGR